MRLPLPSLKTAGKVAVGATAVGVGSAYLAGAIPGTDPGATIGGITDGIGDVWNGATSGISGLLQMGPLLVVGGGAVLLLLLLK